MAQSSNISKTTALNTGLPSVDKYWSMVVQEPKAENLYASLLGLRTFATVELHSRVEAGLSYESLERLLSILQVSMPQMATFIRIPTRTLARRKEVGRLHSDESDRLLRLTRLVGLAINLFEGNLDRARTWLQTSHRSLGGVSPLEFATTDVGAREVEQLIGRLEHGVLL